MAIGRAFDLSSRLRHLTAGGYFGSGSGKLRTTPRGSYATTVSWVSGARSKHDLHELVVNKTRLMDAIHTGCKHGEAHRYGTDPTETGMARLSLGDADKSIRDWFKATVEQIGCKYVVDQMGNQFATRLGKQNQKNGNPIPATFMGSHLDTQPTGGRYDGILGVNAGLEVLHVLHENSYQTEGPIGVVNWTNEEGARFPASAVSSAVWANAVPLQQAWDLKEVTKSPDGKHRTMKEELTRIGYLGELPASYESNPLGAHFELHIEQGPILEAENQKIGVVKGAQAYKWFEVTVHGRDSHAGTTPLNARMDTMLCAAKLIVKSNEIAKQHQGLATTGILKGTPESVNTMAHTVTFTLDIRHASDSDLSTMESQCRQEFEQIANLDSERGCTLQWKQLFDSPAVRFHPDCIAAVEESAQHACLDLPHTSTGNRPWRYMTSGAGHDSCFTNRRCPTAMIFTTTRNGISHNPREYCSPDDCALGAQVLLGAVLRYDRMRADRGEYL